MSISKLWWYGLDWLPNQELWPEDIVPGASVESNAETKAVKRVKGKRYVLLYSCNLTRGVYLKLLPTLETTDFLGSLKWFIARRMRPERIYSDNVPGTFIGGAGSLKGMLGS